MVKQQREKCVASCYCWLDRVSIQPIREEDATVRSQAGRHETILIRDTVDDPNQNRTTVHTKHQTYNQALCTKTWKRYKDRVVS